MLENKKILCTSCPSYGHFAPVVAVAKGLSKNNDVTFMVQKYEPPHFMSVEDSCKILDRYGINWTVHVDKKKLDWADKTLKIADDLSRFKPDVTICDWQLNFYRAVNLYDVPCKISILRAEQIVGYRRLSTDCKEKFPTDGAGHLERFNKVLSKLNMPAVSDCREQWMGDINIIPSIPELDAIPDPLPNVYNNKKVEFVGPLFLNENNTVSTQVLEWIEQQKKSGNRLFVITLGTVYGTIDNYRFLINSLKQLDESVLVICPIDEIFDELRNEFPDFNNIKIVRFVHLPVILNETDLVIHHFGHGVILHCLLAGCPTVSIPSYEYDREDNALRLEKIGINKRFLFRRGNQACSSDLLATVSQILNDVGIKEKLNKYKEKVKWYLEKRNVSYIEKLAARKLSQV